MPAGQLAVYIVVLYIVMAYIVMAYIDRGIGVLDEGHNYIAHKLYRPQLQTILPSLTKAMTI